MGAPTNKTIIPGDWVRLEQLFNELYTQFLSEDVSLTTIQSDITTLEGNIWTGEYVAAYGALELEKSG